MLYLKRADLVRQEACRAWLNLYDEVIVLRGGDTSLPLEIDTTSILTVVALCLPLAGRGEGSAWWWLREKGYVGDSQRSGVDLTGANLAGADLTDIDFSRACLEGADLSGACLHRADISWTNLRRTNLKGAHLKGARFTEADLTEADLRGTVFNYASYIGANFTGALRSPEDTPIYTPYYQRDSLTASFGPKWELDTEGRLRRRPPDPIPED